MNRERFEEITGRYADLRIAVVGDFCLDRYLEIDPAKEEASIETGLPVHNISNVRAQPGGAGTILCNLAALGIGELHAVGFCGDDGEGYELRRALGKLPGVRLDRFLTSPDRHTFTYCKPLVVEQGKPPRELSRLDSKNWTPTPMGLQCEFAESIRTLARNVDAILLLEQTDVPETGVITQIVLDAAKQVIKDRPGLLVLTDSRRGLRSFPPLAFKMNVAELALMLGEQPPLHLDRVRSGAAELAKRNAQPVFVTMSELGIVGADASGATVHVPSQPVHGEIDIVGAGDSVTANLSAALSAGATLLEAMELAMAAASIVIHQLGTTGTAAIAQIASELIPQE